MPYVCIGLDDAMCVCVCVCVCACMHACVCVCVLGFRRIKQFFRTLCVCSASFLVVIVIVSSQQAFVPFLLVKMTVTGENGEETGRNQ